MRGRGLYQRQIVTHHPRGANDEPSIANDLSKYATTRGLAQRDNWPCRRLTERQVSVGLASSQRPATFRHAPDRSRIASKLARRRFVARGERPRASE
jgi:hypothetical protein